MFEYSSNPWTVSETDFPATGTPAEQLRFLLNYAVLAPSEYNTQPWLFNVGESTVNLYADRSRRLPVVDPDDRELTISCGAAFLNLRIALRHFGYAEEVEILPSSEDPDLLAHLHLTGRRQATPEEHLLFSAIPQRRTNRQPFEDREVPSSLLSTLKHIARFEGTWLHIIQEEEARRAVANVIAAGDRAQWADKRFRRELATWVRSQEVQARDGLPGYAHGRGSTASSVSPFVVRTFDIGNGEAARDRHLVAGSPVLAVLGTFGDTCCEWFLAGMTAERILLRACAESVWASFVNQPIEVPELRAEIRSILGRPADFPQLVLRMGYGPQVPATPRRSVSEVLL